jgi:hypothetical protein
VPIPDELASAQEEIKRLNKEMLDARLEGIAEKLLQMEKRLHDVEVDVVNKFSEGQKWVIGILVTALGALFTALFQLMGNSKK